MVSRQISVEGIRKTFDAVKAVDGLSFTADPGAVTGFLGPNGAGKTTTLRMLLGLAAPDAGSATIGGQPYGALPAPSDVVGAVLEASGFHPARSGRDHLRVYCTVGGCQSARADEVLALVGLGDAGRRPVRGYSLVLVLDEPANGLDPEGIAWMRRLLRELVAEGRTVLVSSHVLSEVQQLADRLVIVNRGRLVRQGGLSELTDGHDGAVSVRSPQVDALVAALRRDRHEPVSIDRVGLDSLRVAGITAAELGHVAFAEGVELHGLTAESRDLEQIFLSLTAEEVA